MYLKDLIEKVIKKRVIRDGQRKLVKTSDKPGFKIDSKGKEVKISSQEKITRSHSQRKGAIKRKSSQTVATLKRKKSNKLKS